MGCSSAPPQQPKRATKNRYIPPEIVEEILLNLRVKPLLRFSSVSKSWNSMIRGSRFVKKHRIRAAVLGRERIVLNHYLCSRPPSSFPLSAVSPPECSKVDSEAAALVFPFKDTVSIKAFCDEMLYLEDSSNKSAFLWNPSMREYFVLPQPNFGNEYVFDGHDRWTRYEYVYGLGHDAVDDDYKITKVGVETSEPAVAQLYSLRSNSWKEMMPFSGSAYAAERQCGTMGVCLAGALHWLFAGDDSPPQVVVSFDLSTEEYREFELPENDRHYYSVAGTNLSVMKGKLCLCADHWRRQRFVVWMMEEYGVAESWTKKLDLTIDSNVTVTPFYLFDDGRFLIGLFGVDGKGKLTVAYIQSGGEKQETQKLVFLSEEEEMQLEKYMRCCNFGGISDSSVYVESLVSPASYVVPAGAPVE